MKIRFFNRLNFIKYSKHLKSPKNIKKKLNIFFAKLLYAVKILIFSQIKGILLRLTCGGATFCFTFGVNIFVDLLFDNNIDRLKCTLLFFLENKI